jgi:putative endonuclease
MYILTNSDGTVLYIGVTGNLSLRVAEHQAGAGSLFTRKYKVHRLIYYESFDDPQQAIAREKEIKKWRRQKKDDLIRAANPKWDDLTGSLPWIVA